MNLDEHWYVLLTIRSKEEEVCKYLNENEGIFAFSPKMEFYHRVSKQIQLRTLFGGYVFVVSKLSQVEVDRIFRKFPLKSIKAILIDCVPASIDRTHSVFCFLGAIREPPFIFHFYISE